eukprot:COSAG01_NODE_9968_length_2288_cov_39.585199_2_plen_123_part_00
MAGLQRKSRSSRPARLLARPLALPFHSPVCCVFEMTWPGAQRGTSHAGRSGRAAKTPAARRSSPRAGVTYSILLCHRRAVSIDVHNMPPDTYIVPVRHRQVVVAAARQRRHRRRGGARHARV